jgi:hypothetical protein
VCSVSSSLNLPVSQSLSLSPACAAPAPPPYPPPTPPPSPPSPLLDALASTDPEHDPDRTDPLTLGDAFGSRILRDHLLIGAMESSLLDAFTPRQRGLVCALALAVTGLLMCALVAQPDNRVLEAP